MAAAPIRNLKFLALVALVIVFILELGVLMAGFQRSLDGHGDFSAFYRTGVMVRAGELHRLYDPQNQLAFDRKLFPGLNRFPPYYFYHPPFEALLLTPLAFLPYRTAFWIWTISSFVLLWISGKILSRAFPELQRTVKIPLTFLLLAFFPVIMIFLQGQDSALLLLLVTCAFAQLNGGRKLSAGVLLALGLFKFQFIIPLAVLLGWRLGQKFVLAFSATAAALLALSCLLLGTSGLTSYGQMLADGTPEMAWRMPNMRGMIEGVGGPELLPIVLAAILVIWCAWKISQMQSGGFALAVVCALLVSHHGHVYDCILLIIPIFYVLEKTIAQNERRLNYWPVTFFVMLPLYVLLTRLHATWIFGVMFLMLAFTIVWPVAKPVTLQGRAREALS